MSTYAQLVAKVHDLLAPSLAEDEPKLPITRAEGVYLYDIDGRRYLDFTSGIGVVNVGHNHPRVLEAARRQMEQVVHGALGVVLYESVLRLAEELPKILPGHLDMFFFGNSGAEAVEGALKLARYVSGRPGILAALGSFHGRTMGAVTLTASRAKYRRHYQPLLAGVYHFRFPYPFRSGSADGGVAESLDDLDRIFRHLIPPDEVAAIIVEPIQGEGGYIVPPEDWLVEIRRICDQHGILLILDEVQTGFGRTGQWFAAQTFRVEPDIMALAKGIANGFPLAAVAAPRNLMQKWSMGSHGTTFGGNPVACAAALAVIDVIREENLLANARAQGEYLMRELCALQQEAPIIGDVRGKGLMIAVELVKPDGSTNPEAVTRVIQRMLKDGLLAYWCGVEGQAFRLIPPLVINREQMQEAIQIIRRAILAE